VRNSVKNVPDKLGILRAVPANEPAVTFDGQGRNLGYLAESARTNLALRSEEFNNAYWVKNNVSITPNTITAPNGTLTADTATVITDGTYRYVRPSNTVIDSVTTATIYAKDNGGRYIASLGTGAGATGARFDLQTGVVSDVLAGANASMIPAGNGWWRLVYTNPVGLWDQGWFYLVGATGDGATVGHSVYLWGAQLEAGSFASTYIPTTNATVTRPADILTYTDASDFIGQSEGVILRRVHTRNFGTDRVLSVNGTNADGIRIRQTGLTLNVEFNDDGTAVDTLTGTLVAGFNNIAVRYVGTTASLHINGVTADTGDITGWTPATMDAFHYGNDSEDENQYNDPMQAKDYKTAWASETQLNLLTRI